MSLPPDPVEFRGVPISVEYPTTILTEKVFENRIRELESERDFLREMLREVLRSDLQVRGSA